MIAAIVIIIIAMYNRMIAVNTAATCW